MKNADYVRPELEAVLPIYKLTTDCYGGETKVKGACHLSMSGAVGNGAGSHYRRPVSDYLIDPSPSTDPDDMRNRRFSEYIQRAVFYNVTKRTVTAMVAAVFSKYPKVDMGTIKDLEFDIDGAGQSLAQQAKDAMTLCLLKGRGGLLADMPVTEGPTTLADLKNGGVRPTIINYDGENVINWRTTKIGGIVKISLVVIREPYTKDDDGFKAETGTQLLVLRLVDNIAQSEILRKEDGKWVSMGIHILKDYRGIPLDIIPFFPYGATNNDLEIDDAPIYDIAQLNIAHFRDSADYQESNFITSQPTLILTGLSAHWIKNTLNGNIAMGSRNGILLPEGGDAKLLQGQADGALMEAMLHKERQMTALGAKLIEGNSQVKTATEAGQDQAEESNTLTNIAYNLSDAYTKAVKMCSRYVGEVDENAVIVFNTTFNFSKMTPEQRAQLVSEWQIGVITWEEMRAQLVESEIATLEDADEAKAIIEKEMGNVLSQERVESQKPQENDE